MPHAWSREGGRKSRHCPVQALPKLSDDVLRAWGKILAAIPLARLRLQIKSLVDPAVCANFKARLMQHAISPERVDICDFTSHDEYLGAHAEIDMILDTFPYPGGTTSCEALWMGVPTLTLKGDSLLARQGASLLTAAGLPDWIADSEEAYIDKAISFSSNLPKLAALRAELRERVRVSPLCDAKRFAHELEKAFRGMWAQRRTNKNDFS